MTNITKLLIAGWKSLSLIDVHGYTSFTLWTCGCNLKCPFCHNWRIANIDPAICRLVSIEDILEEIYASKFLVTYLHVTGGEPLLQWRELIELFKQTQNIVLNSINTNLTLYGPLKKLLDSNLIHHVALDLKIPPEKLYGVTYNSAKTLWQLFLKSLTLIRKYPILVELRIPVYKGLTRDILIKYLNNIHSLLDPDKTIVVLNQLLGEPIVDPRDKEWCRVECFPPEQLLVELVEVVKSYGFSRVYIKSISAYSK